MAQQQSLDVAIVGGGLAGSALAAVLHRQGIRVGLLDMHAAFPPDFRAEKLTDHQLRALRRLGLDGSVLAAATTFDVLWIARFGKIVERRPNREHGIDYADLVNAIRANLPDACRRQARVAGLTAGPDRQLIRLGSGETVEARLTVVATGLGRTLLDDLGIRRVTTSSEPSLAIGFDLALAYPGDLKPLTYYGEKTGDRSAYLTVFPIAGRARANLFVYRSRAEPWVRAFRQAPRDQLIATMPRLQAILGDFDVVGTPVLRPIHLHESQGHVRDGAVLVGDAFATTCPTGGTGIDKVLTDVERLAALIPDWLASDGMAREKIARFYADPIKRACDENARTMTAYARAMAIDTGALWALRRYSNYYAQRVRYWLRRYRRASPRDAQTECRAQSLVPSSAAECGRTKV